MDIVFLAGGLLDELPGCFYPPPGLEGRDLSFLKPLVFQVMATRFLPDMAPPGTVLHLHEPSYHYLIPAALRQAGLVTVSSVQTNMPVNTKVYGPEVRTLLRHLGGDPALTGGLTDPLPGAASRAAAERQAMRWYPAGGPVLCRACPERPGMTTSACSAWWPGPRTRWTSCRPASSPTPSPRPAARSRNCSSSSRCAGSCWPGRTAWSSAAARSARAGSTSPAASRPGRAR